MDSVNIDLLKFLSSLPDLNSKAERKAFIAFSGYAYIGIYLDFSGNQAAFAKELTAALSQRGQVLMHQFLTALKNAPQVTSHQQTLDELIEQLKTLSAADWALYFPQRPLPTAQIPDPDMLALTVVSTMLQPYYLLGSEEAATQMGQAWILISQQFEQTLFANAIIRPVLNLFKSQPQEIEPALLVTLKTILAEDDALAQTLAQILNAVDDQETAVDQTLVAILQNIREVSGEVVGAVVGQDIVAKLTVKQTVDTVSAGGSVVGVVIGAADDVQIGGQTVEGDIIGGDKIEGDQITTGDITESSDITLGRG